jgi:cysteine desulfurase
MRLIISNIEHPSVVGPALELQRRGDCTLQRARVTGDGVVDVEHLRELVFAASKGGQAAHGTQAGRRSVISVMLANNETGVLQPLSEIGSLVRECHGQASELARANRPNARATEDGCPWHPGSILIHTDAVQVAGKLPINFRELGVDALSISAHKFHGPRGIGALVVRHGVKLVPLHFGGFQQAGLRPGTEDVALASGMHMALRLWQQEADERAARMSRLRDRLEALLQAGDPTLVVNGQHAARLPHTSNVSFPGLNRQALLMALDQAGVACSTGSACASGSSEPSPVLIAMGCETAVIEGALRLSLGATTTPAEVDEAARLILLCANDLRQGKNRKFAAATGRQGGPKRL